MTDEKNKNQNRFLWQARQRSGLSRKAVAHLLGKKYANEISLYESGQTEPLLETALKLEIIYRVPAWLLFYESFLKYQSQIKERAAKHNDILREEGESIDSLNDQLEQKDYCAYLDLLKTPNLPQVEKDKIHAHIRYLMNTMNGIGDIHT